MVKETSTAVSPPVSQPSVGWKSFLALGLLSLVWGSSFILIKKGLTVFDATQVATLRIGISALAFLPVFLLRLKRIDWSKLKYFLIVGVAGSGLPAFLFAIAQTEISSSVTGILNSLTPLFTLLIGILFFRTRFAWMKGMGVALGLGGAIVLILLNANDPASGNLWYALLVILATVCYAASSNTVGAYLKELPSLTISAVSFVLFGGPALLYLFSTDFIPLMRTGAGSWEALGYIAVLAIFGTVLASVLFFQLVKWTSPLFSSFVAYLIPVVALGWGLVDGESIGWGHLLGMGLILSGIYLSRQR